MKKQGFTLIELLAVILILGIIALIAVPTISNILDQSRQGAFKATLNNISKTVENKCSLEKMKNTDITYHYKIENGKITPDLNIKGNLPNGNIYVDNKCNVTYDLIDNKYIGIKTEDTFIFRNENYTSLIDKIKKDNEIINTPITKPGLDMSLETEASLVKNEDDDGDTYYFRGNVKNNYVKFGVSPKEIWHGVYNVNNSNYYYSSKESCEVDFETGCTSIPAGTDLIFRIVRINGDGTVRLLLDSSIDYIHYNEQYDDPKYGGYTYDRDTEETDTDAKKAVDVWYEDFINANQNADKFMAKSRFCSDTTTGYVYNDEIYFGSALRNHPYRDKWENDQSQIDPSFKCPATDKNYGGLYYLKAGLLNVDEASFAGVKFSCSIYEDTYDNPNTYIVQPFLYFWSMSPIRFTNSMTHGSIISKKNGYGRIGYYNSGIRPVINLYGSSIVESGNGTETNPYVIKLK